MGNKPEHLLDAGLEGQLDDYAESLAGHGPK